jgi:DNA-directed RNA polymerase alpha subunit
MAKLNINIQIPISDEDAAKVIVTALESQFVDAIVIATYEATLDTTTQKRVEYEAQVAQAQQILIEQAAALEPIEPVIETPIE